MAPVRISVRQNTIITIRTISPSQITGGIHMSSVNDGGSVPVQLQIFWIGGRWEAESRQPVSDVHTPWFNSSSPAQMLSAAAASFVRPSLRGAPPAANRRRRRRSRRQQAQRRT